ncbi:MAG: SDR family oxidoreductase [Saprospiraceae bacterium]|nr:SDR family oxidoreductase [Saprospiraceae bacterium]MDW8484941.1 SDR family oxidoreductase [Saprospiraceae bacterium]
MSFQGKNFAIVGASSGIGAEIARLLDEQGARLFTYSRRPPTQLSAAAHWERVDVTEENFQLEGLPEVLHGLIYCPGSINLKPFSRISAADFRKELEINVVGAFRVLQQVFPYLKAAGPGSSALLFSTVAVQTGMPFHSGIAAAKGAIEGLVRALAAEWAPTVRINAIAPTLTETPLAAALLNSDEKRQSAAQRHPLRRIATPADIAQTARFLLSEAAQFITGQVWSVDGGFGRLKT